MTQSTEPVQGQPDPATPVELYEAREHPPTEQHLKDRSLLRGINRPTTPNSTDVAFSLARHHQTTCRCSTKLPIMIMLPDERSTAPATFP
jgi:hypothetical protein